MNKRVTVNSKELLLRESDGHASVAYNSIGKHLARIRVNTTTSEANLPTLLYDISMSPIVDADLPTTFEMLCF